MKKVILLGAATMSSPMIILTTVSCNNNNVVEHFQDLKNSEWDKEIKIQVKKPWGDPVKTQEFAKSIQDEFNRLKNLNPSLKDKPDVKVLVDNKISDDKILVQNVSSKKFDFAISSISSIMNADKGLITPKLQTLTNSFVFDPRMTYYIDGTADNSLRQIAHAQTQVFQANLGTFNGSIYPQFYNLKEKVSFYRGMVWIAGTKEEINSIKESWNNKDWNAFKNFGILHGGQTSGGKFKLQEKLFKKHFGTKAFSTLAEEIQNSPKKFKKGKAKDMDSTLSNYKIAFDDEGSFAWTENPNSKYYQATNMEILTVTEPLKYDLGYYRNDFDLAQANMLSQAIINLTLKTPSKDIYGPRNGYNGYEKIGDIYEEVEKWYNKVINS